MIKNLQSLRGVCALLIVAHHFGFTSTVVESFGDSAVAIFMMLSGFVLALAFRERVSGGTEIPFGRFMLKRLERIVPLYLLGQFMMLAVTKFNIAPTKILADVFMVQSWIPSPDYYFSGNSPSWFVSDLMLCYVLFLPTLKLVYLRPRLAGRLATGLIVAYAAVSLLIPQHLVHPIVYIFPPMQFPAFAAGVLLSRFYPGAARRTSAAGANAAITVAVALLVAQMFAYTYIPQRLALASYWWPASALIIIVLARFDSIRCAATRLLHWRLPVMLGNISYALYIIHLPMLRLWYIGLKHIGVTLPQGVDFVAFCIVTAIVAMFLHRFFLEFPRKMRIFAFDFAAKRQRSTKK